MSSVQPEKSTLSITVSGNTGEQTVSIAKGELRSIYIDAPAGATYDIEIQDIEGDPLWGQTSITGDQLIVLHNELVRNGFTVLLSNATNGSYRVVVWRRIA